jgi:hypothetical protein
MVGASIMAGGYLVTKDEIARGKGSMATVQTRGCAGTAACHTFFDATASADTAGAVGELGFALCTLVASGLLSAGVLGIATDPAGETPADHQAPANDNPTRVEAAPTLGGMVIRVTF